MTMKIFGYAKALAALIGAVITFLISVGAPPEWATWLGGVATVLTGLATFAVPNKTTDPGMPVEDQAIAAAQAAADRAAADRAAAAESSSALDKIRAGVNQAIAGTPVVGPPTAAAIELVEQLIDGFAPRR